MTNTERLQKLEQALKLLREVQMSYDRTDHPHRRALYQTVMVDFSGVGPVAAVMRMLKKFIVSEGNQNANL